MILPPQREFFVRGVGKHQGHMRRPTLRRFEPGRADEPQCHDDRYANRRRNLHLALLSGQSRIQVPRDRLPARLIKVGRIFRAPFDIPGCIAICFRTDRCEHSLEYRI